jgi:hypothetical protein
MFNKQRGVWQQVTFIVGVLVATYFMLSLLTFLLNFIALATLVPPTPPIYLAAIVRVIFYIILILFGYIVFSLFPSVRLTGEGLEYRSLFFTRRVLWDEMVDILDVRRPKNAQALVFFRTRQNALLTALDNAFRLYPNQTHGAIVGVHEPVVVLSAGLENREAITQEIRRRLEEHGRKRALTGDEILAQLEKDLAQEKEKDKTARRDKI